MAQSSRRCYCSVPCCSNNKQKFPYLSFHDFPVDAEVRARWVRAIKREEGPSFKVLRGSTYVCSQHFPPEDVCTSARGRVRIKQGAVPSKFHWNNWGKDLRRRWVQAIRREEGPQFVIKKGSTYVCSLHFTSDQFISGCSVSRLISGAVPSLFHWNNFTSHPKRESVYERSNKRLSALSLTGQDSDTEAKEAKLDHDYATPPPPGRGSRAQGSVHQRARKYLSAAVVLDEYLEMPVPGDGTEEALPAGAVANDHDDPCLPSPGEPAYEMYETHPDWAPSLHLGYEEVKATHTKRFDRRTKRQQRANSAPAIPAHPRLELDGAAAPELAPERAEEHGATQEDTPPVESAEMAEVDEATPQDNIGEEECSKKSDLYKKDDPDWVPSLRMTGKQEPSQPPKDLTSRYKRRVNRTQQKLEVEGEPAYEMMATDPDCPPSLNLGQADITHTDTAPSSRRSKRCRPLKREQLSKTTLQAVVLRPCGQRRGRRGGKAAAASGGEDDNSNGDAADTSAAKRISPNLKRKRAYKILLDEEAIPGETSEGGPGSENTKLDIEGRYPQGSWEQATVEAIMNLRTFDAAVTTSHIAQTIIGNLKDENDFLRAQNIKLQWELKSMREKHSADLRATEEELLALRHRCRCTDEGSKTPPAVTTAPDAEAAEAMEIGLSGVSEPMFRNRAPTPGTDRTKGDNYICTFVVHPPINSLSKSSKI